jgi:D-lactate dehydrogenase (cytochrome)
LAIAASLSSAFGPDLCATDPGAIAAACVDAWQLHAGRAASVVRPRSVAEVAAVVGWCASHGVTVVPQGGNTGVMGGAIPDGSGTQVVLCLSRLNRIREIDPVNHTATVEAGCILAQVQAAAADVDRLFPLSFGAEGSCQIGGALATNAGGSNTLRYGNARDLVLGLEVVLADGRVWNGLRKLRKDNTGYDLKQLFLGAEGTLGIITAAVLKLFPKPRSVATVLVALADLDAAPRLLALARDRSGEMLSAFELIPRRSIELVSKHVPGAAMPPAAEQDWFALLEFGGSQPSQALNEQIQSLLEAAFEQGPLVDAAVAASMAQRDAMWRLREGIPDAQLRHGAVVYFDVSVAVSDVPAFIREASAALVRLDASVDINAFGHVGDGNIHFNLLQPAHAAAPEFLARKPAFEDAVFEVVRRLNGSISAEHGVGQAKLAALPGFKSEVELDLMRRIRRAIAQEQLNPGKVVALS